jgi:hypothetical protein
MGRSPVTVKVHLSSRKGFTMQPVLVSGLAGLTCLDGQCSLQMNETDAGRFEVSLLCRKSVLREPRWSMDNGPEPGRYTYHAVFESESASAMVEAVKNILELPDISGRFT